MVTYQSLNNSLTKEVARLMQDYVMRSISHSSDYTDAPDPTCSIIAVNNPNEKMRHIELTGKQEDSVSCGMHIGDAVRQIYAYKHITGYLPNMLAGRPDALMECWRRRILKDIWKEIDWSTDLLTTKLYPADGKEE